MEDELDDIQQCLDKYDGNIVYSSENKSRRNKIHIDGIPEENKESWSVTEGILKKVLLEKLHLENVTTWIWRSVQISKKPSKNYRMQIKLMGGKRSNSKVSTTEETKRRVS